MLDHEKAIRKWSHMCVCVWVPGSKSHLGWQLEIRQKPTRKTKKYSKNWSHKTFANTCKLLQVFLSRLNAQGVCLFLDFWMGWTSCHRVEGESLTLTHLNSLNFNSKTLIFYHNMFSTFTWKGIFLMTFASGTEVHLLGLSVCFARALLFKT